MIISGYRGWERRIQKRPEEGGRIYRSLASSLSTRTRTKLTRKVDWFKTRNKRKRDEKTQDRGDKRRRKNDEKQEDEVRVVAVMFIPYTPGGELVKEMEEVEYEMASQTGVKAGEDGGEGRNQTPQHPPQS